MPGGSGARAGRLGSREITPPPPSSHLPLRRSRDSPSCGCARSARCREISSDGRKWASEGAEAVRSRESCEFNDVGRGAGLRREAGGAVGRHVEEPLGIKARFSPPGY